MLSDRRKAVMAEAFNKHHDAAADIWDVVFSDEDSEAYKMMARGHWELISSLRRLRFHYNIPYRDGTLPVNAGVSTRVNDDVKFVTSKNLYDYEPPPG
jgi:hypothetical protein